MKQGAFYEIDPKVRSISGITGGSTIIHRMYRTEGAAARKRRDCRAANRKSAGSEDNGTGVIAGQDAGEDSYSE
jgi:hypothetical protein